MFLGNNRLLVGLISVSIVAIAGGCTDAEWERNTSYGSNHKVRLYSGGTMVQEWTSTGIPLSLQAEDGWQFVDSETGRLVIVTGDLVITKLD